MVAQPDYLIEGEVLDPAGPELLNVFRRNSVIAAAHKLFRRNLVEACLLDALDEFGCDAVIAHANAVLKRKICVPQIADPADEIGSDVVIARANEVLDRNPPETRFGLGDWAVSPEGISYLENAQVNIFCRKAAAVPYGTHTVFIGEVDLVNVHDPVDPLIYQDATYCFSVPTETKAA